LYLIQSNTEFLIVIFSYMIISIFFYFLKNQIFIDTNTDYKFLLNLHVSATIVTVFFAVELYACNLFSLVTFGATVHHSPLLLLLYLYKFC
jgi:hypothetical protein